VPPEYDQTHPDGVTLAHAAKTLGVGFYCLTIGEGE